MASSKFRGFWFLTALLCVAAITASAQSFRVQCPASTITHPSSLNNNNAEPAYTGPTIFTNTNPSAPASGYLIPSANVNGAIKCQQVSGGDGYSTMADGTQTFMFSFGPLSGLADIANGKPGTQFPSIFNTMYPGVLLPGDPAWTDGLTANPASWPAFPLPTSTFTYNGAVGLMPEVEYGAGITSISEAGNVVTVAVSHR